MVGKNYSGKKIALVVGHSSVSQGAYGNMGISEFHYWDRFLKKNIMNFTDENEYQIFYRSTGGSGYSERMRELHSRIDEWEADISVSFHFNGAGKAYINGHEILYYNAGKTLAEKLDIIFDKNLDNRDRGVKKVNKGDRGSGFLRRGKSKCILVEPFFASHQDKFVEGGEQYDNLVNSFVEFFRDVAEG